MARVNLVLCDLCGKKINDEEVDSYRVNLICEKEQIGGGHLGPDALETGEICLKCYAALLHRLKSDKKSPILETPVESPTQTASGATREPRARAATQDTESEYEAPSAPATEPQRGSTGESTKELLEDELRVVPSRFDKLKAMVAAKKIRGSSCPHSFKSYRDDGVVCTGPPDGFSGDLEMLDNPNGCGKKLTKGEY